MNSQVRLARLNIVDFIGVLLPGLVWTVLLLTANEMYKVAESGENVTPLTVVAGLTLEGETAQIDRGAAFYAGLFIVSLILGYLIKALSSKPAEYLAFPPYWPRMVLSWKIGKWASFPQVWLEKVGGELNSIDVFPYTRQHQDHDYFKTIEKLFSCHLGHSWSELPGYQPFEGCKQLVKLYVPSLWIEIEQREGQVRMLASLFLASCFSLALSILAWSPAWVFLSALATVLLAGTFRMRRHREVEDVYVSTVIAQRQIQKGLAGEND